MGKYYFYNENYKKDEGLQAFSVTDSGKMYFYNIDFPCFREVFDLTNVYHVTNISGSSLGTARVLFEAVIRKKDIRIYYDFVKSNHLFDIVIDKHLEEKAGREIKRIVSIREFKTFAIVKYRFNYPNGKEEAEEINISRRLNGYDELISEMKKFRDRTKNICAKCGGFIVNGRCEKCNSTEIDQEKNLRGVLIGLGASILITFAAIGMEFTDMAQSTGSVIMIISRVMLFLGIVGISFCGIYYNKWSK